MEPLLGSPHVYYQNQGTLKRKWGHYQLGWGQQDHPQTIRTSDCPTTGGYKSMSWVVNYTLAYREQIQVISSLKRSLTCNTVASTEDSGLYNTRHSPTALGTMAEDAKNFQRRWHQVSELKKKSQLKQNVGLSFIIIFAPQRITCQLSKTDSRSY